MQVDGFTPEPSTILFGAIGLAMLAAYRRRVAS
jgi:MYXO-CTERM domain-containing protein